MLVWSTSVVVTCEAKRLLTREPGEVSKVKSVLPTIGIGAEITGRGRVLPLLLSALPLFTRLKNLAALSRSEVLWVLLTSGLAGESSKLARESSWLAIVGVVAVATDPESCWLPAILSCSLTRLTSSLSRVVSSCLLLLASSSVSAFWPNPKKSILLVNRPFWLEDMMMDVLYGECRRCMDS